MHSFKRLPPPTKISKSNSFQRKKSRITMSNNPTIPLSKSFDEHRWVIQIRQCFDIEHEDDDESIPVCIFNVPKSLMAYKPEAYIPQQVALGPYHHWLPEVYEMERYKLSTAKRAQRQLRSHKFQNLVDHLAKLEPRIRSCYHRYLDFRGETLSWMMAVDACFLLEFLQTYAVREDRKMVTRVSSRMSHLVDHTRTKSAHNVILRDVMMLENQIPLFVLSEVLEFVHNIEGSPSHAVDDLLSAMVVGFCKEVCPIFKKMEGFNVGKHAHLLEILYFLLVPTSEQVSDEVMEIEEGEEKSNSTNGLSYNGSNRLKKLLNALWSFMISSISGGAIRLMKRAILSTPVKFIAKIPFKILSNLPGFSILKQPLEYLFFPQEKEETKGHEEGAGSSNSSNHAPLIEEIMIPSVTELFNAGVKFSPTIGDISTISFNEKTVTLHLPTITFDLNTEVILRNLVAYEASAASGKLILTRYTELMNGIIDTEEDVKVLRERGVVLNRLKSDGEVADLWNGMNNSVRLTKVPHLDKVIEDVNKYYNGRWSVRVRKFLKRYVFGSWQFLTLMAAILLLLLMGLQAFCSIYTCARFFHTRNES